MAVKSSNNHPSLAPVAEVLELAQLSQHDGVAQMDIRRSRVKSQLDLQRMPGDGLL